MKWIKCSEQMAPKDEKFLFCYHSGIGFGQFGQCYTTINGNSERTHTAYILCLSTQDILDGEDLFEWDKNKVIEMDVYWMPLPSIPE